MAVNISLFIFLTLYQHFQATENATKMQNTTLKTYGSYLYSFFLHYINILE